MGRSTKQPNNTALRRQHQAIPRPAPFKVAMTRVIAKAAEFQRGLFRGKQWLSDLFV
jgi:hypothetical protein